MHGQPFAETPATPLAASHGNPGGAMPPPATPSAHAQSQHVSAMQASMRQLLRDELFASAEALGSLLLCASRPSAVVGDGSHATSLALYGDALFGRGEHRRALVFYKQALLHRKVGQRTSPVGTPPTAGTPNAANARAAAATPTVTPLGTIAPNSGVLGTGGASPSSPGSWTHAACPEDAELKFKESKCHVALDEVANAISTLEAIAVPCRTLPMNLALGKLYMSTGTGSRVNAVLVYKHALRQNPLALEAIEPLVKLGVSGGEVLEVIRESLAASSTSIMDVSWLEALVLGLSAQHQHDPLSAVRHWSVLDERFPSNLPSLLHLAELHLHAQRLEDAHFYFQKARICDSLNLDKMDSFAFLIQRRAQPDAPNELNRLAHDLLGVNASRPESWVCVALYSLARAEIDKALGFVERALALAPRHVPALQLRGDLLLRLGKPDRAIVSFFHAKELSKDLRSFTGLVDAYLAAGKGREALSIAQETLRTFNRGAGALTLWGRVVAVSATAEDLSSQDKQAHAAQASKAFTRALELDPDFVDATMALADLHCVSRNFTTAIELLQDTLHNHHNLDFVHSKLADVFTLNNQFSDALTYYHTAVALNPANEAAKQGLEKLEKRMRGVDPEGEEEESFDDASTSPDRSAWSSS